MPGVNLEAWLLGLPTVRQTFADFVVPGIEQLVSWRQLLVEVDMEQLMVVRETRSGLRINVPVVCACVGYRGSNPYEGGILTTCSIGARVLAV